MTMMTPNNHRYFSTSFILLMVLIIHMLDAVNCSTCECDICKCSPYSRFDGGCKMDCTNTHMTGVPTSSKQPGKTLFIDLSKNKIQEVKRLEANSDLTHLSFSINNISVVDRFAFEDTPELIYLDFSYNQLSNIPETLFEKLEHLQYLNLSNNRIQILPKDIFKKCSYLNELSLTHNPLKMIYQEVFHYTHELETLHLAHNQIYSLPPGSFQNLGKLKYLDLSENEFPGVPTNELRMLQSLESLDLSGNLIEELNEASFNKLVSLKTLHLRSMKLKTIKKKTFSSLVNLEEIFIENNRDLHYIDEYAFAGMFNKSWMQIKRVSFRNNRFVTIFEDALPFCNLTFLDLRENPWQCDCHLHWIKYCSKDKQFEKDIICASPEKFRGRELMEIKQKDLVCEQNGSTPKRAEFLFVTSIVFMFLLFATLILFVMRDRIADFYNKKRPGGQVFYTRAQSDNEF